MKKITDKIIKKYRAYLEAGEKARSTVEKYIRDITAFAVWLGDAELCKAKVLEYKEHLMGSYLAASVNSMLSSLNGFFEFTGEYGLKVKNIKIQKQIFAKNEKELTRPAAIRRIRIACAVRRHAMARRTVLSLSGREYPI